MELVGDFGAEINLDKIDKYKLQIYCAQNIVLFSSKLGPILSMWLKSDYL